MEQGLNTVEVAAAPLQESSEERPRRPFVPPPAAVISRHFPELEIIALIGSGGMGAVYKAKQPRLERLVALKILPLELSENPPFAERFTREAQTMARLNHRGIVTIHDFGERDGIFYLLLEHVGGPNLRQLMRSGKLEPARVLAIISQICTALQYAHDEGVVHRDVKPENVLLDADGRVKIADFGLAKLFGRESAGVTLTGTGQVMGTPHYMAPEQIEQPATVDHRADIYSLGVVFYELLTGELPIGRFAPPSKKVHVDVRVDEVVLRALEKEPQRRYQFASELKTSVDAVASSPSGVPATDAASIPGQAESTPGEMPESRPTRLCRMSVWGALWAACGVFAVVLFLFTTARISGTGEPPEPSMIEKTLRVAAVVLGLVGLAAPIGATALGFASISRIRNSEGRLYGLPLAAFVALVYPILIADGALLGIYYAAKGDTELWDALLLAWVVFIIVDALAIRALWKAANR